MRDTDDFTAACRIRAAAQPAPPHGTSVSIATSLQAGTKYDVDAWSAQSRELHTHRARLAADDAYASSLPGTVGAAPEEAPLAARNAQGSNRKLPWSYF
jgi:hypothetical protein